MKIIIVVACLIISDVITGWMKAFYKGNWNSTVMRQGGFHKASELFVLVGSGLLEYACAYINLGIEIPTLGLVASYLAVMEIVSIIENLCVVNPQLANLFKPYLEKLKGVTYEEK